ncbi:G-type lectin S-receptor-like serine/threonine-protein kinase At1g34300, partial [Brassica napus]|uniref:G-type lectin S-receptor-like serine/threonine-protein kinase At1g34300 n=1 Tax=Brassica napus TaxID=3708 RepID=UPI00207A11DB
IPVFPTDVSVEKPIKKWSTPPLCQKTSSNISDITYFTSPLLHLTFVACTTIPLGSVLYVTGSNQSSWSSPNSTFSVSFVPSSSPGSFLAAVSFAGNVTVWSAGSVDSRGSLRLLPSGSLRLISGSNTTVWDSGTDGLGVVSATIDDSGELRLLNNRSITVWSSFDHPTDTVVQSQNFTAGMVLRSGNYSFQLERRGNLTLKWNNSTTYWSQGLNSSLNMSLSSLSLHTNGLLLIFDSTHSGGAEIIYSVDYGEGSNNFMFLKLDDDGNLRIYSSATRNNGPMMARWSAVADQCLVYGYCGNFGICTYNDTSPICLRPSRNFDHVDENDKRKGCKRRVELSDCFDNATMVDLDHTRLITDPADPNSEVGSSSCGSNCLLSSTCLASVSLSDGSGNCWQKQNGGSFITGYESPLVKTTSYVKVCGPVLRNGPLVATKDDRKSSKLKLILGVSAASVVMIIIIVAVIVSAKKARKSDWNGENIEEIVMLKHYSYARVKRMTNSFANALGKGGFGTVYKEKLPDGNQDVAVKILKESKGNGEKFINEVASMSRTSHVNIVSLLGFCYEGNKRAIIYEFMPNGSLDKFISKHMSAKMDWEKLYNIALGISRGLEYLHNRCVSRIMHFDIKPQNILMDKDLCPKIADFGLAKLCKNKESIISMLDARGTAGYTAPEVFSKNFGVVSHKSDVYSYGMVVLEMIGTRNIGTVEHSGSNNSSMYFPDWIYKGFERGEIMKFFGDHITKEEEKIARKMVLVGLWCIQTNPTRRPAMIKVIEMLEGSLEALEVPPKHILCLTATRVPDTTEDSNNETSSFSYPSQFERGTLSGEDTLRISA